MHGELLVPVLAEAVQARVVPHVRAVPAMLAQSDIVDVSVLSILEHEDEFVHRRVERAHTSIRFGPYGEVQRGPI
jgi:hypothetical protein